MNQEAVAVGMVLLALGQIASIALTVKSLFGSQRREILPSPLVVTPEQTHVTEQRFADHVEANNTRAGSLEHAMTKLVERVEGLCKSDEARASSLHRRLNVISTNVAMIAGFVGQMQGKPIQLQHEGSQG